MFWVESFCLASPATWDNDVGHNDTPRSRTHLEENSHQSVNDISTPLHSWDISGCCTGNCIPVQLSSEIEDTTQILISINQRQLCKLRNPAFLQEDLENFPFCPLHQQKPCQSDIHFIITGFIPARLQGIQFQGLLLFFGVQDGKKKSQRGLRMSRS